MPISNTKIVAYTIRKKADDVFLYSCFSSSQESTNKTILTNNTINIEWKMDDRLLLSPLSIDSSTSNHTPCIMPKAARIITGLIIDRIFSRMLFIIVILYFGV